MTLSDRLTNEALECQQNGNCLRADLMATLLEEAATAIRRLEANQAPYREDMGR